MYRTKYVSDDIDERKVNFVRFRHSGTSSQPDDL